MRGELGWGARTLTLLAVLLAAASAAVEPAQAPEQINARDAGARADGVHDDAPALQAALDRLADRGGVLDLPAGTYLVGAPLVMRGDNVVLRGDGATKLHRFWTSRPPCGTCSELPWRRTWKGR